MSDVTRILEAIGAGDAAARETLLPLVYDELRRLAAANLAREAPARRGRSAGDNLARPRRCAATALNEYSET